jgi:hypothetical protein
MGKANTALLSAHLRAQAECAVLLSQSSVRLGASSGLMASPEITPR